MSHCTPHSCWVVQVGTLVRASLIWFRRNRIKFQMTGPGVKSIAGILFFTTWFANGEVQFQLLDNFIPTCTPTKICRHQDIDEMGSTLKVLSRNRKERDSTLTMLHRCINGFQGYWFSNLIVWNIMNGWKLKGGWNVNSLKIFQLLEWFIVPQQ